ncbi:TULIP family P47-like protein [Paraburkholderia sp. CNPSo 3155]|uniref:TULIP family P47-like protein n=1 Tax=Paraburkholderia atlantica TaxID=2654982 RepID=UPI00128C498B|nr:TULIP family P47-like protein [Paraburkholderia atlantica]MPW11542.1 TULIP family P47-like protein [Paraburkholderia atlantica]
MIAQNDEGLKADTYGWDTVFAIRVDDVNATIKRKGTSPNTFAASTQDPHTAIAVDVSGTFSDWQITLGGSGKLIHMQTPVTALKASGTIPGAGPVAFTFGAGSFEIEIQLQYVPHTETPATGSGTFHDLKVRHTGASPQEQVVTVLDAYGFGTSTDPSATPFESVVDDVKAAMQNWFNANLIDFEHVFATVNLNRTADQGLFAWLLPTYSSYAYVDGPTLDSSVLGILCMTENRSADGLDQEISPNAIPQGARAGFLIAPERFVTEMLWPSMAIVYKGTQPGNFALNSDKTGLDLANGEVTIDSLKDSDGNSHETVLQNFELTTSDQLLTVDATTRVQVSPGIHAFTHTVSSYGLALHNNTSSGKQSIYYVDKSSIPPAHWTEESEGVEITKILEGVAAALSTLAMGVATDGAAFAAAAIVMGILSGVGSKIPDLIAAANTDDSPSIDLLVFNSVGPLQWTDQADFNLVNVSLNYSVQMGGTPNFNG